MFKNFLTTNVEVSKSEQREFTKYKYPASFDEKVDLSKVNEAIMETWVGKKLNEYLPDDDITIDFVLELLKQAQYPNIKSIQLQLREFIPEEASKFCTELWDLLLSAQLDRDGVPEQLIQEKRRELELERKQRREVRESRDRSGERHRHSTTDPRSRYREREKNEYHHDYDDYRRRRRTHDRERSYRPRERERERDDGSGSGSEEEYSRRRKERVYYR